MKHYAVSCTSTKCPATSSIIRARASNCRHRPVILGDTRPEDPDHYYRKQREERLEQATVDFARGAGADVDADNILEDLSNSEEQSCAKEINYMYR